MNVANYLNFRWGFALNRPDLILLKKPFIYFAAFVTLRKTSKNKIKKSKFFTTPLFTACFIVFNIEK